MTPYYDDGRARIYLGRCEDVLPGLDGVRTTVTSPPYNIELGRWNMGSRAAQRAEMGGPWQGSIASNREGYLDAMPEAEYQAGQATVAKLVAEASTPDAAMFYNHKVRYRAKVPLHPLDLVRTFDGWHLRQEIIWPRTGAAKGPNFVPGEERIYWLVRDIGAHRWSKRGGQWSTVWQMTTAEAGRGDHPVPFPAELPHRAILATTERGDLVLDPYCGSGTTLRVAKRLGRRAVGIESHEPYAEAAARLLAGS